MAEQAISPGASLQHEPYAPASSNKRKRDDSDQDENGQSARPHPTNGEPSTIPNSDQLQERLLQAIGQANGVQSDDSARTAQAALATPMAAHTYPDPYEAATHSLPGYGEDPAHSPSAALIGSGSYGLRPARDPSTPSGQPKPSVGSLEWHQQRKDNHKEVERRRRETINDGINEIAKIVPGCEKNKGSILHRAVLYIGELHDEHKNMSNESATLNAVVLEMRHRIDTLKEQVQQGWAESNKWQQRCREAGLQFDDYEPSTTAGNTGEGEASNAD